MFKLWCRRGISGIYIQKVTFFDTVLEISQQTVSEHKDFVSYNLLHVQMEYVEIDSPETVYFWVYKNGMVSCTIFCGKDIPNLALPRVCQC